MNLLRKFKKAVIFFCVLATLPLSACAKNKHFETTTGSNNIEQSTRTDLLGTVITLSTFDTIDENLFDETFSIVADIDARMSTNNGDSEISHINKSSGIVPTPVSKDIHDLVKWAADFSKLSNGAFDITIGAVMQLWKTDGEFDHLPENSDITKNLPLVNNDGIVLSDDAVYLNTLGMKLDLGGIAKGYACDQSLEYLKSRGIRSALLNFGGNVYVYGSKPDGSPWKIGIQTPYIKNDEIVCTIDVANTAIVTSGGYKRYFIKDNVTYHHILDPKTGYPADNGLLSVTIIDPSSTRADALSTACFVLGLDKGYGFLASMPESEGIFITTDNKIYLTKGLWGKVSLMDEVFSIAEYKPSEQ